MMRRAVWIVTCLLTITGCGDTTAGAPQDAAGGTGVGAQGSSGASGGAQGNHAAWVQQWLMARTRLIACDPEAGGFEGDEYQDLVFFQDQFQAAFDCVNEASTCDDVMACAAGIPAGRWHFESPNAVPSEGPCTERRCDGDVLFDCEDGRTFRMDCSIVPGGTCAQRMQMSEDGTVTLGRHQCQVDDGSCADGEEQCDGSVAITCGLDNIRGYYGRFDCADAFEASCYQDPPVCNAPDDCWTPSPTCTGSALPPKSEE